MTNDFQVAAELLIRALRDDVTLDEVVQFQANLPKQSNPELLYLIHAIIHFISDEDIRRSDSEYDKKQRASLQAQFQALQKSQKELGSE
jgi:hypothetical protein